VSVGVGRRNLGNDATQGLPDRANANALKLLVHPKLWGIVMIGGVA
jgi:hypothetical protein